MPKTASFTETDLTTPFGTTTSKIKVRKYEDGRVDFKCNECDFTSDKNWQMVSTHRRREHMGQTLGRPKGLKNGQGKNGARDRAVVLLQQAINLLNESENNEWRNRAVKAERRLKALRSALKED